MTQKAKPEDNREFKIPRDCFASPLNDENSRISKDTFKIPRDCFASPLNDEFYGILKFRSKFRLKYPRTPKNPNKKLEFPSKNSNFYAKIKEKI